MRTVLKLANAIQLKVKDALSSIPSGHTKRDVTRLTNLDIREIKALEQEIERLKAQPPVEEGADPEIEARKQIITLCQGMLTDLADALKATDQEKLQALLEDVKRLDDITIPFLIKTKDVNETIRLRTECRRLMSQEEPEPEEVESFLGMIKGIIGKRHKAISSALRRRIEEERPPPGPMASERDLRRLHDQIHNFLDGGNLVKETYRGQVIQFHLYGSLITGYSNSPRKQGRPSDADGLSDVDILVVLEDKKFYNKFGHLGRGRLFERKGMQNTAPVGKDTARLTPHETGIFEGIFDKIQNITVAGRNDRPKHLVFTNQTTWQRKREMHDFIVAQQAENPELDLQNPNIHKTICIVRVDEVTLELLELTI